MPIAWDTAGGAGGEDPSSLTTGSVSPSGSDRLMIGASMSGFVFGTLGDTTAFKYGGSGGTDLSQVGADLDIGSPAAARCSVWSIAPGPTGSTTGYASYSGPPQAAAMQASFYTGVDQGSPYGTPVDDSGEDDGVATTRASVTVTGLTSGDWVSADFFVYTPNATELGSATPVAGTNLRRQQNDTAFPFLQTIHVDAVAAGSSLTLEVDLNSTGSPINFQWTVRALPLNEASSGIEAVASDTNTPTDSAVSTTVRLAVATDTNTPTDSAVGDTVQEAVAADTLALTDSAAAAVALVATAVDSVEFSDSGVAIGPPAEVVAEDSVTFSDSAVARRPSPPAPPSSLPLPAKLLGRAPKKKRERPNVTFKPAEEALEAPEAPPAPEREPEIAPAPPPREEPVAPAQIEEPPLLLMPDVDLALVRDAALALVKPIEPIRVSTDTAEPAAPAPDVEPEPVVDKPLDPVARALLAVAGPLAEERAARRKLEAQVQALQLAVKALAANLKRMRQAQAERDARDAEEAENERRRALAKGIADALDE